MLILLIISTIGSLIFFLISFVNFFTASRARKHEYDGKDLKLSVLIPARNEEKNISKLLDSLLKQSCKPFEIIVLDDNSDDKTYEIANSYKSQLDNLKVIKGEPLEKDWIGKNWACYQLAQASKGDILLFIDADVELSKNAIESVIFNYQKYGVALLSINPTQITKSFGEKLTIPLINIVLLGFLPLILIYKLKFKYLTTVNGQVIAFDRCKYFELGGHKAIYNKNVEDIELSYLYKSKKQKIIFLIDDGIAQTRMYSNYKQGLDGLSRSARYLSARSKIFVFVLIILFFVFFLLPFILLITNPLWLIPIVLAVLGNLLIILMSKRKIWEIILYPLQIISLLTIFTLSIFSRRTVWKGRKV
jgi:chlorobactene glucosyltransferase